METKLTINELAPYLPYELKITGCQSTLSADILNRWERLEWDITPILRPLSDLTKEIEHNGDKIILSNFFIKYGYQSSLYYLTQPYGLEKVPYFVFEHLIEKHFDVFGLIEKGLAINMNDL